MKKVKIPYEKRKSLYGYGFISLWLVGTAFFFLIPLAKSLWYSFSEVKISRENISASWIGFKNYSSIFTQDPYYTEYLGESLAESLWKTPMIVIFSLFMAVILNQKFRGRTFARAVFFLPVIIATGPVYRIISGDMQTTANMGGNFSTMLSAGLTGKLLNFLGIYGISDSLNTMISAITQNIFSIVWSSGVQILLFLASLQTIPQSVREASMIEGATEWEYFWKITFPYISPFISANFIYTVIDSLKSPANKVMQRILDMKSQWFFGEASAMAWVYFVIVLAEIALVTFAVRKLVYYEYE